MKLSDIVPWGRSLSEYKAMFSLSDEDLTKNILGCSDGPASFNAELSKLGGKVTSVDPIYQFDSEQIKERIDSVCPEIINQVSVNKDQFVWKNISSPEELKQIRMNSMHLFLNDFRENKEGGRYIHAALPSLDFCDNKFDLALCSHYLFLYSDQVDKNMHINSLIELCRVAREVRIYPIVSMTNNEISPHLSPTIDALKELDIETRLINVDYEFQKGATQMLIATI